MTAIRSSLNNYEEFCQLLLIEPEILDGASLLNHTNVKKIRRFTSNSIRNILEAGNLIQNLIKPVNSNDRVVGVG